MRSVTVALTGAVALLVSGCGAGKPYANKPRPAVVANVSAAITDRGIEVSPTRLGAGPIHLVITNQSSASRELVIRTDSSDAGEAPARSGPINPQGTAEINVDVTEGPYVIEAKGVSPASLTVGAPRPSGQNQVLQP
jgi:hypothetical protein